MINLISDLNIYIIEPLYQVLFVLIPMLLCVAFMTIIERKQLAAQQRDLLFRFLWNITTICWCFKFTC